MSSFGEDGRSIDGVRSVSDYDRQRVPPHELESITHFQLLLNWWNTVNEEKQDLPSRTDFNPAAFHSILPNIAILDTVYKEGVLIDCRTALIGTALVEIYGETTGELATEVNNDYVVETVLGSVGECIRIREPVGMISKAVTEELPFLRSFALYCPLATDSNTIDKILLLVSFERRSS